MAQKVVKIERDKKTGMTFKYAIPLIRRNFGWMTLERTGVPFLEEVVTGKNKTVKMHTIGECPVAISEMEVVSNSQMGESKVVPIGIELPTEEKTNRWFEVHKKIPGDILRQIRVVLGDIASHIDTEAVCLVFYNKDTEEFELEVPSQQVITGSSYKIDKDDFTEITSDPNKVLVLELHSHPFGQGVGFFSGTDDTSKDKWEGRLYANITFGKKDKKFGGLRVKLPYSAKGEAGFIDPRHFFDDIPGYNEEITIDIPETLKADVEEIKKNNKKKTVSVWGQGGWNGSSYHSGRGNYNKNYGGYNRRSTYPTYGKGAIANGSYGKNRPPVHVVEDIDDVIVDMDGYGWGDNWGDDFGDTFLGNLDEVNSVILTEKDLGDEDIRELDRKLTEAINAEHYDTVGTDDLEDEKGYMKRIGLIRPSDK